ncbi:cell division transport system permease protein [Clostridium acetobutylicum]|uniref:Cell division protein FtsX n=1 Tax=Clostridium acetobutylicum (strain ATCC 824 / DSM 792 / JCM 1419 / IAM 19013 / LMG 5710 / NBRC 13948 / NRRL B-527 / VKM B-1787 / 2291 / W) TaxID=272562 RepID=Q97FR6_CLOAB|nr:MULTISPECIES: permease-like cell division protein FtsX [Clostridium]AAK80608.1 Cell division protein FtsX [Clostridium acetobutylicum ATCC 824]ADZ21707.1 Cell division protein FtsX [Clostridium acetobutylicum EA 2018]AEI34407.1 cell division protein [Clostridium acetobutylicum DSM 1731]AWV78975.1 ABC transporter permease [Clostridium acetobutylicum]MBC2395065.1 ABC transporter permease [Clostridium acetobutylicum]
MIINTLKLFFKDALKNSIRNISITIASITTVLCSIFILEIFFLLLCNIKLGISGAAPNREIQVFLNNNIKVADRQRIHNKIMALDGIVNIDFESKQKISYYLKKHLGNRYKNILLNSLPESYTVRVNSEENIPIIIAKISCLKGISEVDKNASIEKELTAIIRVAQLIGIPLFIIFSVISIFLIKNTILLTIYSRREEISVMKYLGATDWFIRWPFIFQGMIICFSGTMISLIIIFLLYSFIYKNIASYSIEVFLTLIPPSFILTTMSWFFLLTGTIIGALISGFTIKKFLNI